MHNARRRGKGQSRVLYWFRTPPGVRVGRSAIDEDAIRLLEEHNPDVQFDWTHILKATPAPAAAPAEPRREAFAGRAAKRKERRPLGEERRAFPRADQRRSPPIDATPPSADQERRASDDGAAVPAQDAFEPSPPDTSEAFVRPSELAPIASGEVEGAAADAVDDFDEDEPQAPLELGAVDRTSAAYQRLGSEALARLRARYAEVMARIAERSMDEEAREQLKARAERLNPDAWVTDEEVRQALEQYEGVFEALRSQVGAGRRRRRRRSSRAHPPRSDNA